MKTFTPQEVSLLALLAQCVDKDNKISPNVKKDFIDGVLGKLSTEPKQIAEILVYGQKDNSKQEHIETADMLIKWSKTLRSYEQRKQSVDNKSK